MTLPKETIWPAEPHTLAKHQILKKYLQRWIPIISSRYSRMLYIDGFSGPGIYTGGEPGSPVIALEVAKECANGKRVSIVCSEERSDRAERLREEVEKTGCSSNIIVSVSCGTFIDTFSKLLNENNPLHRCPTFTLIDPCGFSGIPYSLISRLMGRESSECLITLVADSLNRWVEDSRDSISSHIFDAFGTDKAAEIIGSTHGNRIHAVRDLSGYMENSNATVFPLATTRR